MAFAKKIEPGTAVRLAEIDPAYDAGLSKDDGEKLTKDLAKRLDELDDLHYEAGMNSVLIVLQGRDTSGKDGTIRFLLSSLNAQGCRVAPFKVPTPIELAHDFLWRVHAVTPPKGGMTIFNRSHYEDVLVVRVHSLVPEAVWRPRYEHIDAFERLLADSGTIILKFMLHISKEEQERRLLDRENEVQKAWKLNVGDWKERAYWDDYTAAYEEALSRCSTARAPWYVVPADKKWFRNLAIAETLVNTLEPYRKAWLERLEGIGEAAKAELEEFRRSQA
ncbi:MAG TPA: hypothetical protein PLL78_08510 [Fimbriimonadaceae bacterium]|nr:hypothetical protein [Fimbriimonadaceae bacterium]HRJ96718.1 hypothetical protein [Fimbriimonadaceae bacterium]